MNQEEQATALARWLSGPPGTPPPTALDPEVVESVYALRPELAPPADLDLDELLGSVAAGPLAGPDARVASTGGAGGEVVPFPAVATPAEVAPTARAERRGWARWATVAAGGTSGLGLLVAAAAVLLFVAIPASRAPSDDAAPAASAPALLSQPVAASPAPRPDGGAPQKNEAPAARPAAEGIAAPPPPPAVADAPAAKPMQGGAVWRDPTTIPELSAGVALEDAVADAEAEEKVARGRAEEDAPARAPAASEPRGPEPGRSAAVPTDWTANGWRRGLDPATQQVFDAALTEGEALVRAGNPRGGGDRLAAAVGAPARAGQHAAVRAAAAYLQAGDPAAAAAVARRGLALSSDNTPERSALLVALGDALRASGDAAGAAAAWQEAAAAGAAR